MHTVSDSAFIPLPVRNGQVVRFLGPDPRESPTTVRVTRPLDDPLGAVGSFVGALCDGAGNVIQPLELKLVVGPSSTRPNPRVPTAAVLERLDGLAALVANLAEMPGNERLLRALVAGERPGVLLCCRKRRIAFVARGPDTAQPLRRAAERWAEDAKDANGAAIAPQLVIAEPEGGACYAGSGGRSAGGILQSLEEVGPDQGRVVERFRKMQAEYPIQAKQLSAAHPCCTCSETDRCYPLDGGYAYAVDRLEVMHANDAELAIAPLGAFSADEGRLALSGARLADVVPAPKSPDAFDAYRHAAAQRITAAAPARLLVGEDDGRALVELARTKLAGFERILSQLSELWRVTRRPHLIWTKDTVRFDWQRPDVPAVNWGLRPILRHGGLQPLMDVDSSDGEPLPYPPAFSDEAYLPPEAADAMRYFDEPRKAGMYIKKAAPDEQELRVTVLLEDLNVPWELVRTTDTMHVEGEGWHGALAPCAERKPDDGESLPFEGVLRGLVTTLREGDTKDGVECRFRPRFGEAVDLHAAGVIALELLLATDERDPRQTRERLRDDRAELTAGCGELPIEQRDDFAWSWLAEQCQNDSPGSLWSRRNLFAARDDRNSTRLDGLPPALWQAIAAVVLRSVTAIPGFSYCDDRTQAVPRLDDGTPLPLMEVRGLLALLDDQLFGRAAPLQGVSGAYEMEVD